MIQTVGAQWLMGSLSDEAWLVALVQTATTLPVLVIALPVGALADTVDRRRLMLISQTAMLIAAVALAGLTLRGQTTPASLLGLIFVIGLAQTLTAVCWQSVQPHLVERSEIPQAAALGGMSQNLARAVGPAIGGYLIAAAGAEWAFALNAASFAVVLVVLAGWRAPATPRPLGAEPFRAAIASGLRFVRGSPRLRRAFVRVGSFAAFASGLWALLPVLARRDLGLGSGGYGLLLAEDGIGALAGAWSLPALRARLGLDARVLTAMLVFAAVSVALGWLGSAYAVAPALVLAGWAWIVVLASLNAFTQLSLPEWVRSRGMSVHMLMFLGGQAVGGALWASC